MIIYASVNHRHQNGDGDIRMRPGYVIRLLILLIFTKNVYYLLEQWIVLKGSLIMIGYSNSEYPLLLNSQPRIMHFACSDWFTQSRLSAHIPWFDLKTKTKNVFVGMPNFSLNKDKKEKKNFFCGKFGSIPTFRSTRKGKKCFL